jgi:hypothetical protein
MEPQILIAAPAMDIFKRHLENYLFSGTLHGLIPVLLL